MGFKMPSNTDAGGFVDKPGQYHFTVLEVKENPPKQGGGMSDAVVLVAQVLAGTEPSQLKRTKSIYLNNPNDGHKDGGEFAAKVQARAAIALDLLDPATPAGQEIEIDWKDAEGRQFIAYLKEKKDGDKQVELDGAHLYGVADVEVIHVPKNEAALKGIGKLAAVQAVKANAGLTATPAAAPAKTNGHSKVATPPVAAPPIDLANL